MPEVQLKCLRNLHYNENIHITTWNALSQEKNSKTKQTLRGETGPSQPFNPAPHIYKTNEHWNLKLTTVNWSVQCKLRRAIYRNTTCSFCPTNNFPPASCFDSKWSNCARIEYHPSVSSIVEMLLFPSKLGFGLFISETHSTSVEEGNASPSRIFLIAERWPWLTSRSYLQNAQENSVISP